MLRIDVKSETHRKAVSYALENGVEDFDLGFLRDPETLSRFRLLVESRNGKSVRVFVRGGLGEVSSAELAPFANHSEAGIALAYFVSDPEFRLARLQGDFRAFDAEVRKDLDRLEHLVRDGVLAFYGVGSAAFTYPKDDPDYLSIAHWLSAEDGTPAYPGFRAIEVPFNLYESAAGRLENQNLPESPEEKSAIEAAHAFGLEVYARRPFDAITETQLLRLVAYPDHHRVDLDEAVMRTMEVATRAETDLIAILEKAGRGETLHWAHRLRRQLIQVTDIEQWKEIVRRRIEPELLAAQSAWASSEDTFDGSERATIARYRDAMQALLLAARLWFEKSAAERNERIRARMVEAVPALRTERGIARAAMRIYRSLPGLNCVFVGMRSPLYVDDALGAGATISPSEAWQAIETAEEAIREHLVAIQSAGAANRSERQL
jgi:hypothetical protein